METIGRHNKMSFPCKNEVFVTILVLSFTLCRSPINEKELTREKWKTSKEDNVVSIISKHFKAKQ